VNAGPEFSGSLHLADDVVAALQIKGQAVWANNWASPMKDSGAPFLLGHCLEDNLGTDTHQDRPW
jgi:hypothetical protein